MLAIDGVFVMCVCRYTIAYNWGQVTDRAGGGSLNMFLMYEHMEGSYPMLQLDSIINNSNWTLILIA